MGKHGSPLYPWRVWLAGKQRSTVNSPNSNHIMLFIEIGVDDKILLPRKIILSKIHSFILWPWSEETYAYNIIWIKTNVILYLDPLFFIWKIWQNAGYDFRNRSIFHLVWVNSRLEFRTGNFCKLKFNLNWSKKGKKIRNWLFWCSFYYLVNSIKDMKQKK